MNVNLSKKRSHALTLIEVLVILAVVGVLAVGLFTWTSNAKAHSIRINCIFHLKSIGLAANVWAGDNKGLFPMSISQTNGGTREFATGTNAFRHFQAVSNEVSTPAVLPCATDLLTGERRHATNFSDMNNLNLSYFVGLDATQTNPRTILAGDRNLTNGTPLKDGILELNSSRPSGWTSEMHNKVGNVLMSDSSAQMVSISGVRDLAANTGLATNRLQMPILGP